MKLTLLFGLLPNEHYDEIVENSIGVIQYAADALQKSIIDGLIQNEIDFNLINLPYIGSYPTGYKKMHVENYNFELKNNGRIIHGENIAFNNLSMYKQYSMYKNAKKALDKSFSQLPYEEKKIILIYAIHSPFLKACTEIKRKYHNVKIIQIVPDLPEFMRDSSRSLLEVLHYYNQKYLKKLYSEIDGFVLLSPFMKDSLNVGLRPWTTVEGIYNKSDDPVSDSLSKKEKYLLYTGTLAFRYGVMNLIKAFMNVKDPHVRLVICGDGDSKDRIISLSSVDKRIDFRGQIKREQALELQRNATLLVNPRTPEGEFTKFSFPSKTMEYLASGTPTLLYQLPGIPEEYYQYSFSLKNLSIDALTLKIEEILSLSMIELNSLGQSARNFILSEKNPKKQVRKIIDLFDKV